MPYRHRKVVKAWKRKTSTFYKWCCTKSIFQNFRVSMGIHTRWLNAFLLSVLGHQLKKWLDVVMNPRLGVGGTSPKLWQEELMRAQLLLVTLSECKIMVRSGTSGMHFLNGFADSAQEDIQDCLLCFWFCGPSSSLITGESYKDSLSASVRKRISEWKSRFIQSESVGLEGIQDKYPLCQWQNTAGHYCPWFCTILLLFSLSGPHPDPSSGCFCFSCLSR